MPVQQRGFLPTDPEAQYELMLRVIGLCSAVSIYNALEIAIAAFDNKPGTQLSNGISFATNTVVSALLIYKAWQLRDISTAERSSQFIATSSTLSAILSYSAAGGALVSVANTQYRDAIIEASVSGLALLGLIMASVIQRYAQIQTKVSLLDLITCKDAPQHRELMAASALSSMLSLPLFAYFAFKIQNYGTVAGECIATLTSTGLFVKTLAHATKDDEHLFSKKKFAQFTLLFSGAAFLFNGLTSFMNAREKTQYVTECIAGGILLFAAIGLKMMLCVKENYCEETETTNTRYVQIR